MIIGCQRNNSKHSFSSKSIESSKIQAKYTDYKNWLISNKLFVEDCFQIKNLKYEIQANQFESGQNIGRKFISINLLIPFNNKNTLLVLDFKMFIKDDNNPDTFFNVEYSCFNLNIIQTSREMFRTYNHYKGVCLTENEVVEGIKLILNNNVPQNLLNKLNLALNRSISSVGDIDQKTSAGDDKFQKIKLE